MIQPQVENLPDFVLAIGRKNLSDEVIEHIQNLITKLYLVDFEHRAEALNNIGVLQSYVNNFQKSANAFRDALACEFSDSIYSNYVQALEEAGEYKLAIQKSLEFLNNHPNNQKMLYLALSISRKYFLVDYFYQIVEYSSYHLTNKIVVDKIHDMKNMYERELKQLNTLEIDLEYLSLLINTAFVEVKKIHIGRIGITSDFNQAMGYLSIIYEVYGADFNDIKLLNKNFDEVIFNSIENQITNESLYFDHLSKFSIGFVIGSDQEKAA